MEKLIESLKRHEGFSDTLYLDQERILTCGWGHALRPGGKLPEGVAEAFFKQDVADAVNAFDRIPKDLRDRLDVARRRVIVEMIFNLGLSGTLGFHKMWASIGAGDFGEAAAEMLNSKWAHQVKGRAVKLAYIMRHGE